MAIKKSDAAKLTEHELAAVARAEEMIDDHLGKGYLTGREVTIGLRELNLPSPRMREELIMRYRNVGWVVTLVPDQRDGDFLKFL